MSDPTTASDFYQQNEDGAVVSGRDNCHPIFRMEPKYDGKASKEAGKPIFRDEPFVTILMPGDSKTIPDLPVSEDHKRRWPAQWAAFINGQSEIAGQTALEVGWVGRAPRVDYGATGAMVFKIEKEPNLWFYSKPPTKEPYPI